MKTLARLGLCSLIAPLVFAGSGPGSGGFSGGGHGGAGTAPHPGRSSHAPGRILSFDHERGHRGVPFDPYGYGLSGYGGYFGDYPAYGAYGYNDPPSSTAPPVVVVPMAAPAAAAPLPAQVAHPVMHDYTQPAESPAHPTGQGNQPLTYLIAFHDGNIRMAMTYWIDGGTLHYLDKAHKERQAALSAVDRELSAQLNRERHVPFGIQY